jgi:ABC-2 type transport system permease protein
MKGLSAALYTEIEKTRKSKICWITFILFAFIAVMMALLVYLSKHPELLGNTQVLSAKASMVGNADWPAFFNLLDQVIAMIGLIGFGFATSWIFGREYTDRTVKDLLALPVSRYTIVFSKLIVVFIWCVLLSLTTLFTALISGLIVGIEGWAFEMVLDASGTFCITALLTLVLCTPLAFLASWSRGFLVPLGFMIMLLIISQFLGVGLPNAAIYFPWAIPAFYTVEMSTGTVHLTFMSYAILFSTSLFGLVISFAWWRYADQT